MLAYHEATGTTGTYTVTATWQHLDPFITTLTIAGEEIETTPEHPFFVLLRGWVLAGDLRVGDSVRLRDGSYALVEATETVYDPQVMYNVTVAEAHTYFVGDDGCTVHNVCGFGDPKKLASKMKSAGNPRPANHEPHHLIPTWLDQKHPFVERARDAGWDVNEHYNGLWLPNNTALSQQVGLPVHTPYGSTGNRIPNHPEYDKRVLAALDALEEQARTKGWTNSQAFDKLINAAGGFELYISKMGGGVCLT